MSRFGHSVSRFGIVGVTILQQIRLRSLLQAANLGSEVKTMAVVSKPNQWLMMGMKRTSEAVWIIFCATALGTLACSEGGVMTVPEGPQFLIVQAGGQCPSPHDDCEPLDMLLWERVDDAINWLGGCPDIQSHMGGALVHGQVLQYTKAWFDAQNRIITGAYDIDSGIMYVWWGNSAIDLRKTLAHEGGHALGMGETQARQMETTCVQDPELPPGPPCG